jgi:hypothetical protein
VVEAQKFVSGAGEGQSQRPRGVDLEKKNDGGESGPMDELVLKQVGKMKLQEYSGQRGEFEQWWQDTKARLKVFHVPPAAWHYAVTNVLVGVAARE